MPVSQLNLSWGGGGFFQFCHSLEQWFLFSFLIIPVKSAAPNLPRLNNNLSIKIFPLINLIFDSKEFIKECFENTLFEDIYKFPLIFLLILNKFFLFFSSKLIIKFDKVLKFKLFKSMTILKSNIYSNLEAKIKFNNWKKI